MTILNPSASVMAAQGTLPILNEILTVIAEIVK